MSIQVVLSIAEETGGPSYILPRFCSELAKREREVELFSIEAHRPSRSGEYSHQTFSQNWRGIPLLEKIRLSASFEQAISRCAPSANIIHSHGLWSMPNVYAEEAARASKKPLIISAMGMLGTEALRISGWRKRLFWSVKEKHSARHAVCLHATCDREYREIRAFGFQQPVAIVPYGIDLPDPPVSVQNSKIRTALFLRRLHPERVSNY